MANWGKITRMGNVEDRRGAPMIMGGLGLGGVVLVLALNFLFGGDLGDAAHVIQQLPVQNQTESGEFAGEDAYEVFASRVLGSNNVLWSDMLEGYEEPTLVLFRQGTQSACGGASSAVGPHYCPLDETIYLDETFFDELESRFGADGGDVAEAYVMAHEVGHHVQQELGLLGGERTNESSIATELQADCLAGIWAGSIREQGVLNPGEIREAMDAAAAVGDDRIQERVSGQVNPETWTHGSSEQRVESFMRGYDTGAIEGCGI